MLRRLLRTNTQVICAARACMHASASNLENLNFAGQKKQKKLS